MDGTAAQGRQSVVVVALLELSGLISGGLPPPLASFPGLLCLQFLIACSMQKQREKAWGISWRDPWHDRQNVTPPLNSQVIYETDLAFCASYKDWQKGYRVTGVKIPKYPAVTQLSRRAKRWHYLELHCLYHSHPSVVKLQTQIRFTGRTYLSSGTCFNSLASL